MRAGIVSALLLLSGCGSGASGQWRQEQNESGEAVAGLECATDGAPDYGTGCTVERAPEPSGTILTLRSPTGSFRRLRVTNGRIEAADGAEPARMLGGDNARVEVAIGGDRYRIPRTALR
jgi:hypothetical protein